MSRRTRSFGPQRSWFARALSLFLLLASPGCAGTGATRVLEAAPSSVEPDTVTDVALAPGDVVTIRFPHRPTQDRDLVVLADGTIAMPFVGTQPVLGRSLADVQRRVTQLYDSIAYRPDTTGDARTRYLISAGDILEVRFRDATQFNTTLPVRPDGRITLPLVKSVLAEGKTPEVLERELIAMYNQVLKSIDLIVIVKEFTSERVMANGRMARPAPRDVDGAQLSVTTYAPRNVFVAGEVRTPGFVGLRGPLTAMQSIISAGGALRTGRLERVLVLRKTGVEKPVAITIDLGAYMHGKAATDIPLRPFDIVIVPKTKIGVLNEVMDQYLYQLLPATRNINFTYFYDIGGRTP